MNFDKAAYRITKERINGLIKDSLLGCGENPEGFISDGVICPDVYEKQGVRILCVLAESYGYDGNEIMTNIEDQMKEGKSGDILGLNKSTVKTPRRLAILLYLLQRSANDGSKVMLSEFEKMRLFEFSAKNTEILQDALSKVGWINVKKASRGNGTKLNAAEVDTHAHRNQEILRQQIEAIAPNLIIVCGEAAFRSLYSMKLLGPDVVLGRKWKRQDVNGSQCVFEVTHPGYYKWGGYGYIYESFNKIYDQIV